jgi:hypothetical protein
MKNQILKAAFFLCALTLMLNSCNKDEDTDTTTPPVVLTARDSAVKDYNDNFIGTNIINNGWTGSTATCNAGICSQASNLAVIKRINYFRRLVGLNDQCILDTTKNSQQQETALMMSANNSLDHMPPMTWLCYTTAGATGAGSSNLALGPNSSSAIWGFIRDDGSGNAPVGHRRWILHSRKQRFCYGSTDDAMALYVFYTDTNTIIPSFIAYPPKGYVPQQLIPTRWSLSIPNADFSAATVSMTGPTGTIPTTIVSSTDNGYGDNTIVWVPVGVDISNASDVPYTVTIDNIVNTTQSSFTYTTTIIKP